MSALTFDTLKFVKELESAGVPQAQAEAQARALAKVLETNLNELATKRDLADLERALKSDIQTMELRLTIKLGAFMAASIGLVAAIVKLL